MMDRVRASIPIGFKRYHAIPFAFAITAIIAAQLSLWNVFWNDDNKSTAINYAAADLPRRRDPSTTPTEYAIFMNLFIPENDQNVGTGWEVSLKNSLAIAAEQIQQIDTSYAAKRDATVYITSVSKTNVTFDLEDVCPKGGTKVRCEHLRHFTSREKGVAGEIKTLMDLHGYCQKRKSNGRRTRVAYIHNKGSLHPSEKNTNWRRAMTDAVTSEMCLNPPDGRCNACGLLFATPPRMFTLLFPGNFFSATCEHVNRLLPPEEYKEKMFWLNIKVHGTVEKGASFTDALFGRTGWAMGEHRYTPEHWIGSHPGIVPCDLSVVKDYWYWEDHVHSDDEFKWSMFPRHEFNATDDFASKGAALVRDNPDLRLRDYGLLAGLLHRWINLYNETPPETSWIWSWLPDGSIWKRELERHGNDVVRVVTMLTYDRNLTAQRQAEEEDSSLLSSFARKQTASFSSFAQTLSSALTSHTHHREYAVFLNLFIPERVSQFGSKRETSPRSSLRIAAEQIKQMEKSYAAEHKATVYITSVSRVNYTLNLKDVCPEGTAMTCVHLRHRSSDKPGGSGELVTLADLYEYCRERKGDRPRTTRVVYLHNKGSLQPGPENTNWRRAMTDAVTSEACLNPPDDRCNACGLLFSSPPRTHAVHFPGNFFASTCEHVNRLLPPEHFKQKMSALNPPLIEWFKGRSPSGGAQVPPFSDRLHGHPGWSLGAGRYMPEHWIGSHPGLVPCDLSVVKDHTYWQNHEHVPVEFKWSMFPRGKYDAAVDFPRGAEAEQVRDDPDLRLRDYGLLPGYLYRWNQLYNETPPESSWIWSWFPDGDFWKRALERHGRDNVVRIVTGPGFDRNRAAAQGLDDPPPENRASPDSTAASSDNIPVEPSLPAASPLAASSASSAAAAAAVAKPEYAIFLNLFIPFKDLNVGSIWEVSPRAALAIAAEQIRQMGQSYAATHNATLYVTSVGRFNFTLDMEDICPSKGGSPSIRCVHVRHYSSDRPGGAGEAATLTDLYDYCQERANRPSARTTRVVYLHNKGSLHPSVKNSNWRRAMTAAVTSEMCLNPPDDRCNACGLLFATPPRMFTILFPGNFFAATCDHVNRLHPPELYKQKMLNLVRGVLDMFKIRGESFSEIMYGHMGWVMGTNRYTPEHWIGSHPGIVPCDLSVEKDYWYWMDNVHSPNEFRWSMFPRYRLNVSDDFPQTVVRDNPDLRLRDYGLLAGYLYRWIELYNTTPPESSWVWSWFPDSWFWKLGLERHGRNVVRLVIGPNFDRNRSLLTADPFAM